MNWFHEFMDRAVEFPGVDVLIGITVGVGAYAVIFKSIEIIAFVLNWLY